MGIEHLEYTHCPFCGREGDALMAFGPSEVVFECEVHGRFKVGAWNDD